MKQAMFLSLALLTAGLIQADASKFGVYDPEAVANQSKEWQTMSNAVERDYEKKFDDLRKEADVLKTSASKFQEKAAMMNEVARESEQETLMRKNRDLEARQQRLVEDYKVERQKVTMRFLKKMEDSVTQFAQAKNFSLIVPKGPGLYAAADVDQTKSLADYMNGKYDSEAKKIAAPAQVAAAKPAADAKKVA